MIKSLRRKLIAASMFSLAVVLFVILGGVNWMSYQKVVSDADAILAVLGSNGGIFPQREHTGGGQQGEGVQPVKPGEDFRGGRMPGMSPETPYESRYFSALVSEQGEVVLTETGQIAAVDAADAADYALRVWNSGRSSGFLEDYRYLRCDEAGGSRIIFLDCGRSLSAFRTTLLASVALALVGLTAVLVLLLILSKRIVRPVAESYEKQKRFITDAGHELKTPLTIISADTDLAEMEWGENPWLTDIRRQTQRLTGLTNDLIYLSRMEEERPQLQWIEFPISDVVEEMAQSFQAPAKSQNKQLSVSIQPMVAYTGDEKAVRQLISVLLDNALKYSPAGGSLSLRLEKRGRGIQIAVSNTTAQPIERETLVHLFDRFYRADPSRNTQTGGYGLGLSIAKSIVTAHKGKIWAESSGTDSLTIFVNLTA
jgi:two-component system sensor histidine kinase CiaH